MSLNFTMKNYGISGFWLHYVGKQKKMTIEYLYSKIYTTDYGIIKI